MVISEVNLITFSPTHTSRKVGEAIMRGTKYEKTVVTDLTCQTVAPLHLPASALAIITVPVYGGHVAPLAVERMKNIHADGTPAVIVVVYGNRAYEKALAELDGLATSMGFKVIAAGTFIGEHSYSTEAYPIAAGRPDADDIAYAEAFGGKVAAKIAAASDSGHLYEVDVNRIVRPKQPFFPLFRFLRKVIKMRKSGIPLPRTPQVSADLCKHCGVCVKVCPAGAILKGDECNTLADKCIKCCACVKSCPHKARTYDTPFAAMLSDCFKRQKEDRILI